MRLLPALALTLAAVTAQAAEPTPRPSAPKTALVIHGGAGVERKDLSAAEEQAARAALKAALLKGSNWRSGRTMCSTNTPP